MGGGFVSAALSGLLLILSFPHLGHPAAAWVALVPLLVALAHGCTTPRAFQLGLVTGIVHFAGTLYWLPRVMIEYGGLTGWASWGAYLLLIAFLALFPALFAVAVAMLGRRFGPLALLLAPAVWVTTELGRIHLFTGFPWELLGYSQTGVLPVAQLASLVGVLGVSALLVVVNGAIAYAVIVPDRRRWMALAAVAGLVFAVVGFGVGRLQSDSWVHGGTPLRVSVVQGNIAQHDKWNPALRDTILDTYLGLTRQAVGSGAQLVVWPEAATPFVYEHDVARSGLIQELARTADVHLLLGTTHVTGNRLQPEYYNAAVLVDDDGQTAGVYRKHHLVPFGEYVPLRRLLFFVSPLVEAVGDFTAGPGPEVLPLGDHLIGTAICYEVVYPGLVRGFVTRGSHLLTTVTNDAWYGRTAAPHQHFQQATMRAIEQGRFLVRAANTGVSGVIDPFGRVVARTPLFERQVVTADVRLLEGRTLYSQTGDMTAWACALLTALLVGSGMRRSRRPTPHGPSHT